MVKLAVITIITILLISACSSSSSTPDPEVVPILEQAISGYLAALEAKDLDGAMSYLAESEDRSRLKNGLSIFFNQFDSWEFSNIEIEVISQGSKKAEARVERDVVKTTEGEITEEHRSETAKLVKVDGKWLIESME